MTVIQGVIVADPASSARPRCDVEFSDGVIVAIRPPSASSGGDAVDGDGLNLFPGLIDVHVHLCLSPDHHPEDQLPGLSEDELYAQAADNARVTLAHGVTTVRDLGSRGDSVRRLKRGSPGDAWPRVICSGPALTIPGGHCHYVGDEIAVTTQVPAMVTRHAEAGDEWIKLMVTGGALTRGSSPDKLGFDRATISLAVEQAHSHGLLVAAHVLSAEGAGLAVACGVDTVEHGIGLAAADLGAMRTADQALVAILSPSARVLAGATGSADEQHRAKLGPLVARLREMVRTAIETGVDVLAGTDAGTPNMPHGLVIDELRRLEAVGMSREAVLLAATATAARHLRRPDLGTVRVGAAADLLLLEGDPLDSLDWLESPVAVLARGCIVEGTGL